MRASGAAAKMFHFSFTVALLSLLPYFPFLSFFLFLSSLFSFFSFFFFLFSFFAAPGKVPPGANRPLCPPPPPSVRHWRCIYRYYTGGRTPCSAGDGRMQVITPYNPAYNESYQRSKILCKRSSRCIKLCNRR